jgi:hypothetical protein
LVSELQKAKRHVKQLEKKLSAERLRKPRLLSKASNWLVTIVGLLLGAVALFWPRITVEPETQVERTGKPMAFKVTNTGWLTLHDVQPLFGLCQLTYGRPFDKFYVCDGPLRSKLRPTTLRAGTLSMDEKFSFRFDDAIDIESAEFTGADLSVIIQYRPALIGWVCNLVECEREFRFQTRKEVDGKFSWQARSSSTPAGAGTR